MKAVIFDFNGTMVFDSPYHKIAWQKITKKYLGKEITEEEYLSFLGFVNEQMIYSIMPNVSPEENKKISLEKEAMYRDVASKDENYKLVNGLEEYLDYLKEKNMKITVSSASIKDNIDFFVRFFKLEKWMNKDHITYDDGIHPNKESMYRQAANNLDVEMKDCIIFEDSISGVTNAKKAGAGMIIGIGNHKDLVPYVNDGTIAFIIDDFTDSRIKDIIKK